MSGEDYGYCDTCKFASDRGGGHIVCQRYPPVIIGNTALPFDGTGVVSFQCSQPAVTSDDTCGEWVFNNGKD